MASASSVPKIGTVVWAHVPSWPWWPALVVPYERVLFLPKSVPMPARADGKIAVQFFSDGKIALVRPSNTMPFEENLDHLKYDGHHAEQVQNAYDAARAWIWDYGVSGSLPFMAAQGQHESNDIITEEVLDSDATDQVKAMKAQLAAVREQRKKVREEKEVVRKLIAEQRARSGNASAVKQSEECRTSRDATPAEPSGGADVIVLSSENDD